MMKTMSVKDLYVRPQSNLNYTKWKNANILEHFGYMG